ncbi:MAG: DNA polymerase III subunit gamma/tau [Wolbachia endosymbiont of Meromenopon meropis]|nr:DNA polymerase III subunit gamma/tau [Wolbachia endosymbiont of Meromenopon meropis]
MNIALKYRPSNFRDLIGQDVLVRILKNAFILNKLPQAILLSGSSGVGKTTTARIIALCLNCSLGPTFEPCGSCENCLAIKSSRHPDVIEIDAASHTSVEDIKVILEDVCYSPITSKFKVYIIDEVHMLSNSAFNALLKTLEEPPFSVKFILATTEIRKIPATIIARCQKFDLQKIPTAKIVKRLNEIVQEENYIAENNALQLIASHCSHSMRNALFLLHQAALYSEDGVISVKNIMEILNLVNTDTILDLLRAILNCNLKEALSIFDNSIKTVNQISVFEGLLQIIQLICRYLITKEIDHSITECEENKIKDLSVKKSLIFFSRLWRVLLKGIQDIKTSSCNDIAAEIMLISLCYLSELPSPEQVIKKVLTHNMQQGDIAINNVENAKKRKINFDKILQLLQQNNQIYLYKQLCTNLQLVDCKSGYLRLKAISNLSDSLRSDLKNCLDQMTQQEWIVEIDASCINQEVSSLDYVSTVKDILDTFKGAKIVNIENKE